MQFDIHLIERATETNNTDLVIFSINTDFDFQGIINECWIRRIKSNRYWVYMLYFS